MTAEERAVECLAVPRLAGGGIDWDRGCYGPMPADAFTRVVAAINAAVAAERERCAAIATFYGLYQVTGDGDSARIAAGIRDSPPPLV